MPCFFVADRAEKDSCVWEIRLCRTLSTDTVVDSAALHGYREQGGLGMKEGDQNDNAGSVWRPGLSHGRTPPLSCQREQAEAREPVQWSEDHSWTSFLPFYLWVFRLGGKYLNLMSHLLPRDSLCPQEDLKCGLGPCCFYSYCSHWPFSHTSILSYCGKLYILLLEVFWGVWSTCVICR